LESLWTHSQVKIIRHPKLASDIREIATHYADISERVLDGFWSDPDASLLSIQKNPRIHHFDGSGLRRANLRKYPYHLEGDQILLLALRHDRRHPDYGLDRE
jgi:plasmid stabilization system protein ParE